MSVNQLPITNHRLLDNDNFELNLSNRINNINRECGRVNFNSLKCWLCLSCIQLESTDYIIMQKLMMNQNLEKILILNSEKDSFNNIDLKSNEKTNKVRLITFKNQFLLIVCKCKKKLAHFNCFNNFIDLQQNGCINVDILCSKCNYKYEFNYPYNTLFLKLFDKIDHLIYLSCTCITIGFCLTATYWCCLTYGALTVVQIYGYKSGFNLFNNSNNKAFLFTFLPCIPIALVSYRFLPWSDLLLKLLPSYWLKKFNGKIFDENLNYQTEEDEDEKEDEKFLIKLRLITGGLLLPTVAVSMDKLIFSRFNLIKSSLIRTAICAAFFVSVKSALKIICFKQKTWQQSNRDIKNYDSSIS